METEEKVTEDIKIDTIAKNTTMTIYFCHFVQPFPSKAPFPPVYILNTEENMEKKTQNRTLYTVYLKKAGPHCAVKPLIRSLRVLCSSLKSHFPLLHRLPDQKKKEAHRHRQVERRMSRRLKRQGPESHFLGNWEVGGRALQEVEGPHFIGRFVNPDSSISLFEHWIKNSSRHFQWLCLGSSAPPLLKSKWYEFFMGIWVNSGPAFAVVWGFWLRGRVAEQLASPLPV